MEKSSGTRKLINLPLSTQNEIIDFILHQYENDLGSGFEMYRNHVYRVFNLTLPFVSSNTDIQTLSIACAFHDLGIWTHKTFDYLQPSINLALEYSHNSHNSMEIETIINFHHKITSIKTSPLAELFRQSDLIDLTLGLFRFGRKGELIRQVRKTFPNKGFHVFLLKIFLKNLFINPLKPLPMYKW